LGITLILLFSVPAGFSGTAKIVYIFMLYTLISAVFYTASNISYNTLISLATDNPKERVTMGTVRFFFAMTAGILISSATMTLVDTFGPGQRGWTAVAAVYGIIFIMFQMITVFGVREMRQTGAEPQVKKSGEENILPFGRSLIMLVKNKYFLVILGLFLVMYISGGVSGAIGIYYATYKLGNPNLLGILSMSSMIPMLIMLSLTPKITGRWGIQKVSLICTFVSLGGACIVILSNGSLPVLIAGLVLNAIGEAPLPGGIYALVAETAEYAFLKFKVRMDGMIYSCCSVGIKVGSGLGVAIVGLLLATGGFDGLAAAQPQSALSMINGMYIAVPLCGALLRMLFLSLLKVEKVNQTLKQQAEVTLEEVNA
jgi:GPH family glycoside/pentoside/hexuronide:cation symporter